MVDKKILLFMALLFAACSTDPMIDEVFVLPQTAAGRKLVNTSDDAVAGSLIVRFNDEAIARIEETAVQVTRSGGIVTRSGIESVDEVLTGLDVSSLRRLFPCNARHEARTRAAGLHKWYIVTFDADAGLESAALRLASVAEVANVQFDTRFHIGAVGSVKPLKEADIAARAGNIPFNDPQNSRQWHYVNTGDRTICSTIRSGADINVKDAWALTTGNPNVVVAIVDEGVKYTHPDLAPNMWCNTEEIPGNGIDDDMNGYIDDIHGYNFAADGDVSWDREIWNNGENNGDSGHGTHVAGIVAAVNNNATGVSSVAGGSGQNDGVRLMSCQIFSGGAVASGSSSSSAAAIKYAADNGAAILQCSFGGQASTIYTDDIWQSAAGAQYAAIKYFIESRNCAALDGGIVIFAAGNDATNVSSYPGAFRDYISVTAFGPDYLPAYYTNYGPGCNIAAPGGDYTVSANAEKDYAEILSTVPSELSDCAGYDYGYMQGTSMACPHVSGVAALGLSYALDKGKHFTLEEFKAMLLTSVNDLEIYLNGSKEGMNLTNYHKKMGTGAVDAYQLLMQIEGTPCLKAKVGVWQLLPLTQFFGGSAANLTYSRIEITQGDKDKLGITQAPVISNGNLKFKCSHSGCAKIRISAIAGGTTAGTGADIGGMEISKEFAIIARTVQSANGGWL